MEIPGSGGFPTQGDKKPFGGIQLIFSGDFFQLPPVKETFFCFESESFNSIFDKIINLTKVFRQNDNTYKKLLLNMRKGLISKKSINGNTRKRRDSDNKLGIFNAKFLRFFMVDNSSKILKNIS